MKNKLGSMKKIQVIIAFVLIVVIVGTTVGYQIICAKTEDTEKINEQFERGTDVATEEDSETFSCEGTTGMGVTSQLPAFSVSAAVDYIYSGGHNCTYSRWSGNNVLKISSRGYCENSSRNG